MDEEDKRMGGWVGGWVGKGTCGSSQSTKDFPYKALRSVVQIPQ